MPIRKNTSPVTRMQRSADALFVFASLRSRYFAYTSWFLLPIGINACTTFLRTYPTPIKIPSPLIYIIPAKKRNSIPETEKASDNIWMLTAMLSVKNPLYDIMKNEINEAIPKEIPYFMSNSLFSCFTFYTIRYLLASCCLYSASSALLQYTKCPGATSRKEGVSTA